MRSLFFFDTMLTTTIITVVYWLGLLGVLVSSIGLIFNGSILVGLATLVGGAIALRIWCELLVVIFKIHENLQKIANRE